MEKLNLPEGYQHITPYLILNNADGFYNFMNEVFGAGYVYEPTMEDGRVKHANISINGSQLMYCSSKPGYEAQPAGMFIYVTDCDTTYKKAIAAGATSINEPDTQEYGRSSGVKDPFGNTWWITSL